MTLAVRARQDELMDADDLDPAIYAAVLRDLAKVNRVTLAARPTLDFLRRATHPGRTYRLLDVGFGDGDMLRSISRWGERHGIDFALCGVDLNPRSAPVAQAHDDGAAIRYVTGDYADLAGEPWDLIVSSLVAHHMTHDELIAFVRFMERHARVGWFINDLHRHRVAHLGYPLLARAFGWHPIVRHDGTLSIARSYRPDEWPALLREADASDAQVRRIFPFRLCVEHRH